MSGHNRPDFRVTLDGDDLTPRIAPRLLTLSLSEKRGAEADQLDLVIEDAAGHMAIPRAGALLQLSLGWESGPDVQPGLVDKGSFKVDEAEWGGPPDIITVRARSANLSDAYRARREGSWRGTTLGAIITEIAQRNGLTALVDPTLAAIAVAVLGQDQRSDMALVRFLGERHDATATVKNGALVFAPIGQGVSAIGSPLPSFTLTRSSGDRYAYRRAERDRHDGVEARWYDQDKGERRTVRAAGSGKADAKGKPRRLRRTFATEADAKQAAEAENRRVARAAASFDMTLAYGDPRLYPDQPVSVRGFKPEIDGQSWLIAEATHALDTGLGLTTSLKLEVKT